MQIPQDIVPHWSTFVDDWCLGIEPVEAPTEVASAFDALSRLWPEYLVEFQNQGVRGLSIVMPAIARGLTLAACEPLAGFGPVLSRLRGGEESALAELQFAEALVRCSLTPTLEPRLGSKTLDCLVEIGTERVFAEVISPEMAASIMDVRDSVMRMATEVIERTTGTRTEIFIAGDSNVSVAAILDSTVDTPPDGTVHNIEGTVWIRRDFLGPQASDVGGLIANPDPQPVFYASQTRTDEGGIFTSATVRRTVTDDRAHRLLTSELPHFSRTEQNVLVVRVTNVPGGLKWWVPLGLRWFQPHRNRRVGAIVLFEQVPVVGTPPAMRQRWRVVENPYACEPVSRSLIESIRALDEGDD